MGRTSQVSICFYQNAAEDKMSIVKNKRWGGGRLNKIKSILLLRDVINFKMSIVTLKILIKLTSFPKFL